VALVRTTRRLSRPAEVGLEMATTRSALAALVEAYRTASPGVGRDELAEAVCLLAPPSQWKALTGNPPGLVACVRDLSREEGKLCFWLSLRSGGREVHEQPTLLLEKPGLLSIVGERKRVPLPVVNLPRPWAQGWDGAEYLYVQVPMQGLTPGAWRVRVEGTVGKDRVKWTSEPRKLVIEGPSRRRGPVAPDVIDIPR
jgi:hypothetical protein